MCCLGFLAEACGVTKRKMLNVGVPAYLPPDEQAKMPAWSKLSNGGASGMKKQSSDFVVALLFVVCLVAFLFRGNDD